MTAAAAGGEQQQLEGAVVAELEGRLQLVADHVERCDEHVAVALDLLPAPKPTAKGRAANAYRHLVSSRSAARSALVVVGRLPAGAALVDIGAELARRYGVELDAGEPVERPPRTAAATAAARDVDRRAIAQLRVALNLDDVEAAAVLELVDRELEAPATDVAVEVLDRVRRRLAPRVLRARLARGAAS